MAYPTAASDFLPALLGTAELKERQSDARQRQAEFIADRVMKQQEMAWEQDPRNPAFQQKQAEIGRTLAETDYYTKRLPMMQQMQMEREQAAAQRQEKQFAAAEEKARRAEEGKIASDLLGLSRTGGLTARQAGRMAKLRGLSEDKIAQLTQDIMQEALTNQNTLAKTSTEEMSRYLNLSGLTDPSEYRMESGLPPPPKVYQPASMEQAMDLPVLTLDQQRKQDKQEYDQTATTVKQIQAQQRINNARGHAQFVEKDLDRKYQLNKKASDALTNLRNVQARAANLNARARDIMAQAAATRAKTADYNAWVKNNLARITPILREVGQQIGTLHRQNSSLREMKATIAANAEDALATLTSFGITSPETASFEDIEALQTKDGKELDPKSKQNLLSMLSQYQTVTRKNAELDKLIQANTQQIVQLEGTQRGLGVVETTPGGKPIPPPTQESQYSQMRIEELLARGTDLKRGVNWQQHVREIQANPKATAGEKAWIRELDRRGLLMNLPPPIQTKKTGQATDYSKMSTADLLRRLQQKLGNAR